MQGSTTVLSLRTLQHYDVIVIGGGHAGAEAAWAAANALEAADAGGGAGSGGGMGARSGAGIVTRARVALITMDPSRVGAMSCNPAIGGLAKGQMVREIDALGGLMGLAADAAGIMFKVLNQSKGAAVRGPRAQCDKYAYAAEVQRLIATRPAIEVIAATVDEILVEDGRCVGVRVPVGAKVLRARAVVLTTGTFMRALMHTGAEQTPGGRVGEGSAVGISGALRSLGFELGRLKTGTPPRLERSTIDWDSLERQEGDATPQPFSDLSPSALVGGRFPALPQVECRLTRTSPEIHALIRSNLHLAPMYSGQVEAECGPRYCPSLEDKVVRFADRDSHQVFLEPESLTTSEVYCNGISTSLPQSVQAEIVRGMPGCARAQVLKWGYAVEYDMVWPHQICATCETKRVRGLYLAGQINGTSGYEEAAAQGLVAGLNAARRALGQDGVTFGRSQAYIGVMMDDLVTRTPREPYRMFTSRAEHRLLLRGDTADERLTPLGRELGLVDEARWSAWLARSAQLDRLRTRLAETRVGGDRLADLARRPEVSIESLHAALDTSDSIDTRTSLALLDRVVTDIRYAGYVARQHAEVRRQEENEHVGIPSALEPEGVTGLRREAQEALRKFRPATLGQAGRLAGVSPADLTLIALAVRRVRAKGGVPATSTRAKIRGSRRTSLASHTIRNGRAIAATRLEFAASLSFAAVAQLAEHLICNHEVVGSIPIGGFQTQDIIGDSEFLMQLLMQTDASTMLQQQLLHPLILLDSGVELGR
jgi:tRNA uridine 5-carboxymethylaminomethyl modification enzyme